MQTMVFSKNMIDYEEIDINADPDSDAYVIALMEKLFPGSWLPYGAEMILRNAEPFFKVIDMSSGRLDYIETLRHWRRRFKKYSLKKYWYYLSLLPRFLSDKEFRYQLDVLRIGPNKICFEREIMDHYRIVFEKS